MLLFFLTSLLVSEVHQKGLRAAGPRGKQTGLGTLCKAPERAKGCIHPLRVWETLFHFTSSPVPPRY